MDIISVVIDLFSMVIDGTSSGLARRPPETPGAYERCTEEGLRQPEESRERFLRDCLTRAQD